MKELAEDCYFIQGIGLCSNIYVLRDGQATVVIDTGDGSVELKEKPDYVFLTHGHYDHTGGVRRDWEPIIRPEDLIEAFPFRPPKNAKPLEIRHLKVGSFDLEFMHTPGHTPGGTCIYEKSRAILFSGDTLFSEGWIGRTDFFGGDEEKLAGSLRLLWSRFSGKELTLRAPLVANLPLPVDELDVAFLCPGHGMPLRLGAGPGGGL